jgi:GNAT superfamily N-acetyltransferase
MTKETWEKLCLAAVGLPGFEAWAALSGDELASAIIVAQHGSVFSVPFAMSHRRFLGDHVNSALFYCTAKELLQREGVDSLFYTVQSLDAPPQVDEFKFRLGLQPKLVRQCVEFHPLLAPLATAQVHRWVQSWARWDSQNPFPAKAEGMLRFHLEGKKPLAEQAWPERLQKERDRLNPRPAILAKKGGIEVALATPFDVNELVDLHAHCFSWREHWPVQLGRPFLLAIYRWFTTSPGTHVLVARKAGRILGFTTLSDRPYNLPMLRACMPELIRACLRRPWVMLNPELFARYVRMVTGRGREDGDKRVAQIAFTGVDLSARGTGVAQILKAASLDLCRKQGMAAVITGVRRHNQPARQLNERAGFVEIPRLSTRKLVYLRLDLENPLSASGPLS